MAADDKVDSKTMAKIAENMKVLDGDPLADEVLPDDVPVPAEDLVEVPEDAPDDDSTPGDTNDVDGDDSTPKDDDDEPVAKDDNEVAKDDDAHKADDKKDAPQLSDAYYRAAINSGMSEEEIIEFYATNPELAEKTYAKLYDNMNRLTNEYAALGKHKREQATDGDRVPNTSSDDSADFKKIDLAKLKEEFPEDSLVDVIGEMQNQMASMDKELKSRPVHNEDQAKLEKEQEAHTGRQIEDFFNETSMVPYKMIYGKVADGDTNWTNLMPGESASRIAVIESAQQLVEGAIALGTDMSVHDALERAHLLVTQPVRNKIIRKDIMDKVIKRSKGITLRPSDKANVEDTDGKPGSEKDMVSKTEARMKKVFNRRT